MKKILLLNLVFVFILVACQKEEPQNPFDTISNPTDETEQEEILDPTSIAGLHQNIFLPTCANSGCHDGTFEPDFRTIESSYNTLVNHPVIKNDAAETYTYRVVKGNVAASQLVARVTFDIDGNSGVMPLVIESNSDYETKREEYIQNIEDWIADGAKDVFGN